MSRDHYFSPPPLPPEEEPRQRFQYSLRTLFVIIALLGVALAWTGWQIKFVRERLAAVREISAIGGNVLYYFDDLQESPPRLPSAPPRPQFGPEVPAVRRWLGDRGVAGIWLPGGTSFGYRARLKNLFPEAKIFRDDIY